MDCEVRGILRFECPTVKLGIPALVIENCTGHTSPAGGPPNILTV